MRVAVAAVAVFSTLTSVVFAVDSHVDSRGSPQRSPQPFFQVQTLAQIRDILVQLEAPIVSTLVQRFALPVNSQLYQGNPSALRAYLAAREKLADSHGRYAYGTLEYPFTLPCVAPDKTTSKDVFPPGRFHQDTFIGNSNLTVFYTQTLVPLMNATINPYFFHLSNATQNAFPDPKRDDGVLELDVTLLQLLSNRAHIGKIVAETKFAGDTLAYTSLIKAKNATGIRTLVTNTTQAALVLTQADNAAIQLTTAWSGSGALVPSTFQESVRGAAAKLFGNLIEITTEIEIQYLLSRLA